MDKTTSLNLHVIPLDEKTAQLDRFFNLALDLFCIADMDGHFRKVNSAWERILGFRSDELEGHSFMDYVHPDDREKTAMALTDLKDGKEICNFINRYRCRDGSYRLLDWRSSPYEEQWIYAIARDVTEQKEREQEQLLTQKLEATALLAGGIAHDFNNLLTVVCGSIELARHLMPPSNRAGELLDRALQSAFQGRDLTSRFLTFAKGGSPVTQVISVRDLVRETVALFLAGSNIASVLSLAEDLWEVEADSVQLTQVFQNIITNARESMPGGGLLKIRAANLLSVEDHIVTISFTDDGPGIAKDHLLQVFDPYFSTKSRGAAKGMGLGLTIAKSIVEKHRGTIKVLSEQGAGTTVVISLPATPPLAAAAPPECAGRILVMDDEPMVREMAGEFLKAAGYVTVEAETGEKALQLYREAREAHRPFTAVILDLTVKGGLGGEQTIAELLKIDRKVKAIVVSGYADHPCIARYADYGFKAAVIKPFRMKELLQTIATIEEKGSDLYFNIPNNHL